MKDLYIENQEVIMIIEAITNEVELSIEEVKDLLLNSSEETVNIVLESVYAIDIALTLNNFDNEDIKHFYNKVNFEHKAKLLEQSTEEAQTNIVNILSLDEVLAIFQYMSKDDIVDILGNIRTNLRKELLNLMRSEDNKQLQNLLLYAQDSVGGIMTTEYIALKESMNAKDALIKIKEICNKTEVIETIFIVDDKKQLVGTVDLRDLFTSKNETLLKNLMDDNIITITPDVHQEEASNIVSKYDLKVIAVVNRRGSMLGIITIDDIIDVLVEEQTEDILKLGGVSGEEGNYSNIFSSVKVRLPWLLVNLFTASFSAIVISKFEDTIVQVVALSAIMPIVAATSGNLGSQTLAIIIRGITLGEINLKDDWLRVFKEISVGILNSFVIGSIASVVVYIMYQNIYLSVIIFMAMIFNSIISSSCGFFIPLTLKALKLDPALASSIFLTAATDVMAFVIFLGLANAFLTYLI